jgi:structural maintenance of chromosomes protein 5
MVCGPNGTGKSTILNAICLGLGGEPKVLGRADDAREFIAHNEDRAIIEIELFPFPGKVTHIFRRVIDRNKGSEKGRGRGASTFLINGEKTNIQEIQRVVQGTYHISVDNLCTFLPQDRVGSFSGFNSQELLIETEKSMSGTMHLYAEHQQLVALEDDFRRGDNDVGSLEDELKRLKLDNERLEREKERMEERQKALDQMDLLFKKRKWVEFDQLREACFALKTEADALKGKVEEGRIKVAPLQDRYAEYNKQHEQLLARFRVLDGEAEQAKAEMDKQAKMTGSLTDGVDNTMQELSSLDSERRQAEKVLKELRTKLKADEAVAEQAPTIEECQASVEEATEELRTVRPLYDKSRKTIFDLTAQQVELRNQVKILTAKLHKMNDEKANRRQKIFRQQPQLEKVCQWVDANKNEFRKPVWGPIVCEVTLKSNNAAAYLEQHVPNSTLKSFVVECKADYDLLYQKVRRDQGLPINILTVENGILKPVRRMYSEQKMNVLKKDHGVSGYLDESFTAPDPILQALRQSAQVHQVLVGTEKTQESIDHSELLAFLANPEDGSNNLRGSCIFAAQGEKSFKYTSSISRHSKKSGLRADEISGARMLAAGVNPAQKEKVQGEIQDIEQQFDELARKIQEVEAGSAESQRQCQEAKARQQESKETLHKVQRVFQRISATKQKIAQAEHDASTDNAGEKKKLLSQLKKRLSGVVTALETHASSHHTIMNKTYRNAGVRLMRDEASGAASRAKTTWEEARAEFGELEQQLNNAKANLKTGKNKLKVMKADADRAAPIVDDNGDPLPLKDLLEALPYATTEEIDVALEEFQAKANSIDDNPDVVRQYEQRKKEIAEKEQELSHYQDSKDSKVQEINRVSECWSAALKNSLTEVNSLFGKYMADLGCAGEISLTEGDYTIEPNLPDRGNFKNWGVEIKVKFRENSTLEVLSAQRQSGGERSVSTIMYLMALQEIMVSPFRCVDEINQGLDERNERLVFKRIVANSTRPPSNPHDTTSHAGQYWLITPKLLPNLYDMEEEGVKVHIIKNGPTNNLNQGDFTGEVLLLLRNKRVREEEDGEEGDIVDDENGSGDLANTIPKKKSKKKQRTLS